ncbi:O-antigen ligase family protein [Flavobacterium sp.]|uniref:O-antigen ligase family protein n=1 Tax=Flavobacterium sp. TaxID=239 RepID=UPI004047200B
MIIPMLYVALSLSILLKRYTWNAFYIAFLKSLRFVYLIPSISYILFGGNLNNIQVYGIEVIGAFESNNYGWAAFLVIVTHWQLIQFKESKFLSFWSVLAGFNFVILMISGSRSGLLSLMISILIWFITSKGMYIFKFLLPVLFISTIVLTMKDEESVLAQKFDKTLKQFESTATSSRDLYVNEFITSSDTRTTAREIAQITFYDYPLLNITGMGIFQFKEGLKTYANWASPSYYKSGVHNSYGEIYFGCGIFVFAFFLFQFVIKPLRIYFKYLKAYMLFVPGIFIIPYFESDLTAGQFLFFPWFITIFVLLSYNNRFNLPNLKP